MISTRDLSLLLEPPHLRLLCQSLAMLDAIIEPEWESRYYSFDSHWNPGEALASMRDGSGDEYVIWFGAVGTILKGFAHESVMSPYQRTPPCVWPGVLDDVPEVFSVFWANPAFERDATTFCIWRTPSDISWQRGEIQFPPGQDPDGSADLLVLLDGNPRTYQLWAEDYYEHSISLAAVTHIYEHRPLSQKVVTLLNSDLRLVDVREDAQEIGY
ncbi:hypothetical protein IAD21_02337 [Abditibacteriota bacterium]|nr:hypothetical protein IAD21_02337 [Abditibacteriota bacterium]